MDILNTVHHVDARELDSILTKQIVDVTVTSPPYFDLKDYGYKNQIGFGQKYNDFLDDLFRVFQKVFRITKSTGTLWVVIDVFRKEGELTLLPFDFANKLKQIGWRLQEIVIWHKDRTVPWAHKGQMRNSFEYILVFSKSDDFKFDIDQVRDITSLKKWWVRYPERYNPKGKAPEAVWDFDIPTQGSWGNGYIDHFCPLPEALIERILRLTTYENDVVLDPFAGSGTVPSVAHKMKRQYVGFELNADYIEMFQRYLRETKGQKRLEYESISNSPQDDFQKTILDLRSLKFARVLQKQANNELGNAVEAIFVEPWEYSRNTKYSLIQVCYHILRSSTFTLQELEAVIQKLASKKPLSKYGIVPVFKYRSSTEEFKSELTSAQVFTYTVKNTHSFQRALDLSSRQSWLLNDETIVSPVKVAINEKEVEKNG